MQDKGDPTLITITLYQPWASLIAANVKTIETRSWRPAQALLGQRIGIHAAKKLYLDIPPCTMMDKVEELWGPNGLRNLPRGAILCTAVLKSCQQVFQQTDIPPDQRPYGDFHPQRYMWFLEDVIAFDKPIPARGYQGFWHWHPETETAQKHHDLHQQQEQELQGKLL